METSLGVWVLPRASMGPWERAEAAGAPASSSSLCGRAPWTAGPILQDLPADPPSTGRWPPQLLDVSALPLDNHRVVGRAGRGSPEKPWPWAVSTHCCACAGALLTSWSHQVPPTSPALISEFALSFPRRRCSLCDEHRVIRKQFYNHNPTFI